jgi:hypothetical protein
MVLALIADISAYPIEILRAVTHDAVAGLPLQYPAAEFLVCFMARRALQLADEFADENRRCDRDGEVHMSLDAADLVNEHPGSSDEALFQIAMNERLDAGREQRLTEFRVPSQVQVDFAVIVAGHDGTDGWLKPGTEKPDEIGLGAIVGDERPAVNGGPKTAARKKPGRTGLQNQIAETRAILSGRPPPIPSHWTHASPPPIPPRNLAARRSGLAGGVRGVVAGDARASIHFAGGTGK